MTKRQFMEELRSSLEGMVSQAVIQENMNYYEDYINEQIRNGKNEQDVLNELGSPRLIARSIIDAKGEDDDYVQSITKRNRMKEHQKICLVVTHIFLR
jgi:uncharacterized membrane protein